MFLLTYERIDLRQPDTKHRQKLLVQTPGDGEALLEYWGDQTQTFVYRLKSLVAATKSMQASAGIWLCNNGIKFAPLSTSFSGFNPTEVQIA